MDGHECTEVNISKLDITHRMDAEYYSKEYIYETNQLMSHPYFCIGKKYKVTDGEHGSVEYLSEGLKYLTAENIKKGFVDLTQIRYVSQEVDKKNARASINDGDILISIKGTLGSIAVATKDLMPCNMNRDVAIIKPLKQTITSNYFMALFLMSKYGALQSQRGGSGGVQQMITLGRLREFIIPEFSDKFYVKLKEAYEAFLTLISKSKNCFCEAENFLLNTLKIDMDDYVDCGYTVRNLSSSFLSTGRIDAEYYLERHKKLIAALNPVGTIGSECNIYDKTFTPSAETTYPYIELANIDKVGEIEDVECIIGSELPTRARRLIKEGQILVSSVEGSLDSCALVSATYDNAICSTGFYVIDSEKYNGETLLVLLKSKPIQTLLKQGCSGTILTNISKDEFLNIPLPNIDTYTQTKIKEIVNRSYELREKSKELLECSKHSVEMAIEYNETTAISWLNDKIKLLTF